MINKETLAHLEKHFPNTKSYIEDLEHVLNSSPRNPNYCFISGSLTAIFDEILLSLDPAYKKHEPESPTIIPTELMTSEPNSNRKVYGEEKVKYKQMQGDILYITQRLKDKKQRIYNKILADYGASNEEMDLEQEEHRILLLATWLKKGSYYEVAKLMELLMQYHLVQQDILRNNKSYIV